MKSKLKILLIFLFTLLSIFPDCNKYIVVVDSVNPPVIHSNQIAEIDCTVYTGLLQARERVRTTVTSATASGCGSVTSGMRINQFDFAGANVDRECTATVTVSLSFDPSVHDEATVVVLPPIAQKTFVSYAIQDTIEYYRQLIIGPGANPGPNGWRWTYEIYFSAPPNYKPSNDEFYSIVMTIAKPAFNLETKNPEPGSVQPDIKGSPDKMIWTITPSSGSGWQKLTIIVDADGLPGGTALFNIGVKNTDGEKENLSLDPTGPK